jgi:hypothetical protein
MWILTEEYNDYDQYGEYFVQAYLNKPTREQLLQHEVEEYRVDHVLAGGGRQKWENQWYILTEVPDQ